MEDDLIHCHKCKKKTKIIDSKIVQTNNGLCRISAKYSICKTNKSKFTKKPEDDIKPITKQKLNKKETIIEFRRNSLEVIRSNRS